MKKSIYFVLAVFLIGSVIAIVHAPIEKAQGTAYLGAGDPFALACGTSFTRIGPHICKITITPGTALNIVADNTCRSLDLTAFTPAIPTTATMAIAHFLVQLRSANAVATRVANIAWYNQASCAGGPSVYAQQSWHIREFVATAASTDIFTVEDSAILPLVNGVVWYSANDGSSSSTPLIQFVPEGYFD